MMIVLAVVLGRVGMLQTVQADGLRAAGEQQWTRARPLPAQRGTIFDRNGDELALSVPASTVTVNPLQVVDAAGTAATLAAVLGLSTDEQRSLRQTMEAKESGFAYVARQVDDGPANQVAALDLVGVQVYREDRRMMPGGATGQSVIGDTDIDGNGIAGLERQFDEMLRGTPGETSREIASGGRSIPGSNHTTTAPVPGQDLVLTLDRSVQHAAEDALLRRAEEVKARGGQIIVMDTNSGDVVAMASVRRADEGGWEVTSGNYSAVDAYEPGSVGKVITVAAALNERTVTPETWFEVPWRDWFFDQYLEDSHQHATESMNVERILVQSSNIGTIRIQGTIGYRRHYEYMRSFGLGEPTALGFPGESEGILKNWKQWQGTEKVTVAYGQGVASSPIQLVSAVNAIANRGTYVDPRLVSATVDAEGELTKAPTSERHEVVRPEVARQMWQMMEQVVCSDFGTANLAQVPGLSIAGKTGTGLKAFSSGGYEGASGRAYYSSFVGFFPSEDPQVTVLVSIDEPDRSSGQYVGGTAAAPVFAELAPTMIHELGIQPRPGSAGCEP